MWLQLHWFLKDCYEMFPTNYPKLNVRMIHIQTGSSVHVLLPYKLQLNDASLLVPCALQCIIIMFGCTLIRV